MPNDMATISGHLRIAVVDDDECVRGPLVAMLEDAGIHVLEFAGGTEAASGLADLQALDLVLTDVNMPGIDGVMLAEALWARRPDLPVIFMSGMPRPGCADVFLAKPFSLRTLLVTLDHALAGRLIVPA